MSTTKANIRIADNETIKRWALTASAKEGYIVPVSEIIGRLIDGHKARNGDNPPSGETCQREKGDS